MNQSKVLIIGYSGHGLVAAESILLQGFVLNGYLERKKVNYNPFNLKYFGHEESSEVLVSIQGFELFLGIGSNTIRKRIYESMVGYGMKFITSVHPMSNVTSYTSIGNATLICRGACINPATKIGNGVIINTGAIIEHECVIGDFAHIAPGAVLGGNVQVGEGSFIGANAVVKQGVRIGKEVVIGAGTVVLDNVQDNQVLVGNPARSLQ
ncbi:MAG TPA: acetyltransferase [Saprospiraceae bacterium]|nr:acetyltransferase [Saprospiraceae bacterium]